MSRRTSRIMSLFILFPAVLSLYLGGCASFRTASYEETPTVLDETIISDIYSIDGEKILRAMATVNLLQTPDIRQSHRVAFVVRPPSNLKVEALPAFGIPDYFFSINEGSFKVFIPGKGRMYTGKTSRDTIFSFFRLDMDAREIIALMAGAAPTPLLAGEEVGERRIRAFRNKEGYSLKVYSDHDRLLQSIRLDSNSRMRELEVYNHRGRLRYHAYFEWDGMTAKPRRITVAMADLHATVVDFELDSVSIGTEDDLPKGFFDLPVPPGVELIFLD